MNEQMKSKLTTAYMLFIFDFADPSSADKGKLSEKLTCTFDDLFKAQRPLDKAKKELGPAAFDQLLSLYFNKFMRADGVAFADLAAQIKEHEKIFARHIGRDKLAYLRLIVSLFDNLEPLEKAPQVRRGLLSEAS